MVQDIVLPSEVVDIMRTRPRRYAHGPRRAVGENHQQS